MTRRFAHVAGALACAAAFTSLAACSTFTDNDVAASVDGADFSRDQFEQFLTARAGDDDVVPGEAAAHELTRFVYGSAIHRVLEAAGVEISDEETDAYTSQLPADDAFFTYTAELQRAVLDREVGADALARVPMPTIDDLAARYADRPASLGVACYQTVTAPSSGRAAEIVDQLRAGVPLAEAAGPDAAETIGGTGGDCATFDQLWSGLEQREVVAALIDGRPGVPATVDVDDGWVVVDVQPFDTVRKSIEANFPRAPGVFLAIGLLVTGDITVDPAYGRWDPSVGAVVLA